MDTAADRATAEASRLGGTPMAGDRHGDAEEAPLLEPLERAFATLRRMARNYALLALLDLRRAALQFAWLVAAGILITVLVVTAWLAAVVALAVWLLGQGMSWPGVLLIAALLNLVGAGLVVWRVRNVFEDAPFAATLRQVKAEPPEDEQGRPK
jgi:uncharacterized membrane protein YqjE